MKTKTLYISDLDGTLLQPDEKISSYALKVINRISDSGGIFSYATARSVVTAAKVTAGLNTKFPVITYNGAFIIDTPSNKILHSNFFTPKEAAYVSRELTICGVYPIVYAYVNNQERFSFYEANITKETRFFLESRLGDIRRRIVQNTSELYSGDMFYFACMDTEAVLLSVNEVFKADKRYNCIYQKDIYSGYQWCEILPAKTSKANAALLLKKLLDCERIVSFGDGINDIELFSVSDECYAVSNGAAKLKALATDVIGSNIDDGVARWLEMNVL